MLCGFFLSFEVNICGCNKRVWGFVLRFRVGIIVDNWFADVDGIEVTEDDDRLAVAAVEQGRDIVPIELSNYCVVVDICVFGSDTLTHDPMRH